MNESVRVLIGMTRDELLDMDRMNATVRGMYKGRMAGRMVRFWAEVRNAPPAVVGERAFVADEDVGGGAEGDGVHTNPDASMVEAGELGERAD